MSNPLTFRYEYEKRSRRFPVNERNVRMDEVFSLEKERFSRLARERI